MSSSIKAVGLATDQEALSTSSEEVVAANEGRCFLEVKNLDASITVYIGGTSAVSSSSGHALLAGEAFAMEDYGGPLWMVAASGTPTVSWIEW